MLTSDDEDQDRLPAGDPLDVQFLQVETIKQGVVVSERKPL